MDSSSSSSSSTALFLPADLVLDEAMMQQMLLTVGTPVELQGPFDFGPAATSSLFDSPSPNLLDDLAQPGIFFGAQQQLQQPAALLIIPPSPPSSGDDRDMDEGEDDDGEDDDGSCSGSDANSARNQRRRQVRAARRIRGQGISARQGFLLALTEEERALMIKEGATIPDDADALTKKEMSALRAVARKVRNRLSAQESRQRKKDHVQELEEKVNETTGVNQMLRDRVAELETVNKRLTERLRQLQTMVAGSSRARTGTGSCLLLLALSFGMFGSPSMSGQTTMPSIPSIPSLPSLDTARPEPAIATPISSVDSIANMFALYQGEDELRRRRLAADAAAASTTTTLEQLTPLEFVTRLANRIDRDEEQHDALLRLQQQQQQQQQPTAAPQTCQQQAAMVPSHFQQHQQDQLPPCVA